MRERLQFVVGAIAFVVVVGAYAWLHRGGRKCGPNCHCEDYF